MSVYSAVKDIANKKGKSIRQIEVDLEFGNGVISKWNKSVPAADRLQAVADYLGVTSSYILNKSKED